MTWPTHDVDDDDDDVDDDNDDDDDDVDDDGDDDALWSKTTKNSDVSTGPLVRPFARSLVPLTQLLSLPCSLHLHTPLRSFVRSLAHILTLELMRK